MNLNKSKYFFENCYYLLCFLNAFALITAMTFTSRIVTTGINILGFQIAFTGGVIIIPLTFFIQDITTEIYGYNLAQKMLKNTIFIYVAYVIMFFIISNLLVKSNFIANSLPRHSLSVVISIFIGGTINNYVLSFLKLFFNQKFLALRFIFSTIIGEAIFQTVAVLISWYGVVSFNEIIPFALISYGYKIIFEVIASPLNIFICRYLKKLKT